MKRGANLYGMRKKVQIVDALETHLDCAVWCSLVKKKIFFSSGYTLMFTLDLTILNIDLIKISEFYFILYFGFDENLQ